MQLSWQDADGVPTAAFPCTQPNARKIDETRTRISEDERLARAAQLQRTMQLLVHASECRDPHCVSSNCRKIKEMFMHAHSCKVKVTGGCQLCRWGRTATGCCGSHRNSCV